MSQKLLSAQLLRMVNVTEAVYPKEGPIAVPVTMDFSLADTYLVDLQNFMATGKISMVQALFIDASQSTVTVTVTIPSTGQSIIVKPYSQGYYPVISSNPAQFSFTAPGASPIINCYLLNYPIAGCQWFAQ